MIFKTCPYCGANLDPEEICDCPKAQMEHFGNTVKKPKTIFINGVEIFVWTPKEAVEES